MGFWDKFGSRLRGGAERDNPGIAPPKAANDVAMATSALGPWGIALQAGVGALNKFKDSIVDLTKMAMNPKAVLQGFVAPVASQVGAYNPGAMSRFNLALDNLSAAAGRIFAPVIEHARLFANELNSLYTAVGPELRGAVQQLLPPLRDFGRAFAAGFLTTLQQGAILMRPVFQEMQRLGPIAAELTTSMFRLTQSVMGIVGAFGESGITSAAQLWVDGVMTMAAAGIAWVGTMEDAAATIRWALRRIMSAGTAGGPRPELRDPIAMFNDAITRMLAPARPITGGMTIAAQPARQIGIEQVGEQQRASAFSGGRSDAPAATAAATALTADRLEEILRFLQSLGYALPGMLGAADTGPSAIGGGADF